MNFDLLAYTAASISHSIYDLLLSFDVVFRHIRYYQLQYFNNSNLSQHDLLEPFDPSSLHFWEWISDKKGKF